MIRTKFLTTIAATLAASAVPASAGAGLRSATRFRIVRADTPSSWAVIFRDEHATATIEVHGEASGVFQYESRERPLRCPSLVVVAATRTAHRGELRARRDFDVAAARGAVNGAGVRHAPASSRRRSSRVDGAARGMLALILAATLGAFDPTVTAAQVCAPGYARAHRHVARNARDRAYTAAGIPRGQRQGWTLDHVVPLELGGTNDVANLAPQPKDEAKRKDRDENRLHAAVCSERMTLAQARAEILRRWRR